MNVKDIIREIDSIHARNIPIEEKRFVNNKLFEKLSKYKNQKVLNHFGIKKPNPEINRERVIYPEEQESSYEEKDDEEDRNTTNMRSNNLLFGEITSNCAHTELLPIDEEYDKERPNEIIPEEDYSIIRANVDAELLLTTINSQLKSILGDGKVFFNSSINIVSKQLPILKTFEFLLKVYENDENCKKQLLHILKRYMIKSNSAYYIRSNSKLEKERENGPYGKRAKKLHEDVMKKYNKLIEMYDKSSSFGGYRVVSPELAEI